MIIEQITNLIEKPISGEWGKEPLIDPIIKVLRSTNFTNDGKLDLSNVVERSISQNKIELKSLKYGDIIIEKSGGSPNQPVGRVVYYDQKDGEYLFSNFTSALRPKECVFPRYLFLLLYAHHKYNTTLAYQNKTTGIINLQLTRYLEEVTIPLPPLETQKKIAAILDKADELRRNDQKILEKYDQLAKSVFLDMFGDPVRNVHKLNLCTIRDLVEEVKYGTSAKASTQGEFKYLRMNNITYQGYWDLSNMKFINLEEKDKEKYLVRKGDLLFNRTNSKELVGKTGVFNLDEPMAIAGYLIRVRVNQLANPYFIWGYLNSKHGKMTLENMCKSIVGMANINAQELQDIKLLKPPIELQNKYAFLINEIEKQKQLTQQSLQKSEELFQSLLQRAFKGEFV